MRLSFVTILCTALCFVCLFSPNERLNAQGDNEVHYVSMIRLIANPEQYDGKIVQVKGFVHLGFEENAVYVHEEDYRDSLYENALYLGIPHDVRESPAPYTNHYCLVQGTFKAPQGVLWAGTIEKITRLQVDEIKRAP